MESNLLLIVGTFIYKERVELFSLVLQRLARKCLEHGVTWPEELEVIILVTEKYEQVTLYGPEQILNAHMEFIARHNFPNQAL